ncbi:MAG: hypothetical protein V8R79_00130 [Candidatus Gastranaerophilaceae bacterium]
MIFTNSLTLIPVAYDSGICTVSLSSLGVFSLHTLNILFNSLSFKNLGKYKSFLGLGILLKGLLVSISSFTK